MNICVIGAGYVGLTTATILASRGHTVHAVDINETKINLLNQGTVPIYEPGLEPLINENLQEKTLVFSTKINKAIQHNEIIIIAVGTPALPDGSTDLSFIHNVVETIAKNLNTYKIIVTKSTVPPGTNESIYQTLLDKGIDKDLFDVVSNPEFLKEGSAIQDLLHPDKTVIGTKHSRPVSVMKQMYGGILGEVILTSLTGAELIKYASNAFLATKISFINEMARICDVYNVNIEDVSKGIGTDPRIGPLFLKSGLGYGGSCFPKDVSALHHSAKSKKVNVPLLEATMEVNHSQIDVYLNKLISHVPLEGKKITVWGLTFKPNTDDTRLSPALRLIEKLKAFHCHIHCYDPQVNSLNIKDVNYHTDMYDSLKDSDILIVATEWDMFKFPNWDKVKKWMKNNIILDGRNIYDPKRLEANGFHYIAVGNS